jgi:hypothetical protein
MEPSLPALQEALNLLLSQAESSIALGKMLSGHWLFQ